MQTDLQQALIAYGLGRLARATKADPADLAGWPPQDEAAAKVDWEAYERALAGGEMREPERVLTCIFSLVADERGRQPEQARYYSARPLALDRAALFPTTRDQAQPAGPQLWSEFLAEFERIPAG